jgi:hypothetical protein
METVLAKLRASLRCQLKQGICQKTTKGLWLGSCLGKRNQFRLKWFPATIARLSHKETSTSHPYVAKRDTPDAGLIAFSPEGIIIASNRQARFSLQDLPVTPGQSFDTVFRTSYQRFLAQARIHDSGQITDRRGEYLLLPDFELGASGSDFLQAVRSLLAPHGTHCPISDETIDAMRQHNWPGNFRELKNFILRGFLSPTRQFCFLAMLLVSSI